MVFSLKDVVFSLSPSLSLVFVTGISYCYCCYYSGVAFLNNGIVAALCKLLLSGCTFACLRCFCSAVILHEQLHFVISFVAVNGYM